MATDDAGTSRDAVALAIAANRTVHVNSDDLVSGNAYQGAVRRHGSGRRSTGATDVESAFPGLVAKYVGFAVENPRLGGQRAGEGVNLSPNGEWASA